MVVRGKRATVLAALSLLFLASTWGGSIYDDLMNNDFPALKRKVEMLGSTLSDEPYIAYYFRNAREFDKTLFDFLIEHGADPNRPDADGIYPLHWAIKNFGARESSALLGAGASAGNTVSGKNLGIGDLVNETLAKKGYPDINLSQRASIWNPIALSVYYQKPDVLALFADDLDPTASAWLWTEKEAPRDQLNLIELPFWKTRLSREGLSGGAARCFSILWKKNMELPPEQRIQMPADYESPLLSVLEDDLPALKRGLARDMDNSIKYLPYAVVCGSHECLDFLMKYNDLSAQSLVPSFDLDLVYGVLGETAPLYAYALMNGDMEMLAWFGDRGANFNKPFRYASRANGGSLNNSQSGALTAAIQMDLGLDFARYLLSKGADPNAADGSAPLLLAFASNDDELASLLLDAGADPNLRVARKSVIGQAALTASPAILRKCLEKKGSVTLTDSSGWAALHYAALSGDPEKVRILVEARANAQAATGSNQRMAGVDIPYGSTALEIARIMRRWVNADSQQKHYDEIVDYLSSISKPPAKR
jgi:ankyrin repeat protein